MGSRKKSELRANTRRLDVVQVPVKTSHDVLTRIYQTENGDITATEFKVPACFLNLGLEGHKSPACGFNTSGAS